MVSEKRKNPNSSNRESILDKHLITLTQVSQLIDHKLWGNLFPSSRTVWPRYFQSPVNKAAQTLGSPDATVKFDDRGVLESAVNARRFLQKWLGLKSKDKFIDDSIGGWLDKGEVLNDPARERIAEKLRTETLQNHTLYNQAVCRLVRRDQLRYDPDYQAVYHLVPGQLQLLRQESSHWKEVNQNRRAYWGVSETFQSLVAMFDSELGKNKKSKQFIRLEFEDSKGLTPYELNRYSPLRYWAPPRAFSRHVFHMIFWKSVITNRDLYNRIVIQDEVKETPIADRIEARVNFYHVIINWFNAANFRIAKYDQLFRALMAISQSLSDASSDHSQILEKFQNDVPLNWRSSDEFVDQLFYPPEYPHTTFRFTNAPQIQLKLPFKTKRAKYWELAHRYRGTGNGKGPTQVADVLKFIRDRSLELILWSRYQMEIRSVGVIPVQHLYGLELTKPALTKIQSLVKLYEDANLPGTDAKKRRDAYTEINDSLTSALKTDAIDDWVRLKKVYGGIHREILEPKLLSHDKIQWLEKSNRVLTKANDPKSEDLFSVTTQSTGTHETETR